SLRTVTLYVDTVSTLRASLESDFLTAGLIWRLSNFTSSTQAPRYGFSYYSGNYLIEMLDPGTYTLEIYSPNAVAGLALPFWLPPGADLNVKPTLYSLAQEPQQQSSGGPDIPASLNTIRYMGLRGAFDFQSAYFRVPQFTSFTYSYTTLSVAVPSVLR